MIPKAKTARRYFFFDTLEIDEYEIMHEYTDSRSMHIGSVIAYYNKTRSPKRFVQRKVEGMIRIYRDRDKLLCEK